MRQIACGVSVLRTLTDVRFRYSRILGLAGAKTLESSRTLTDRVAFEPGKHLPQLDGLRGLAILLVTIYRFGREIPIANSGSFLAQAIELGTHGVELFFVLSGFLITGILLDTRGQTHQLRNFFVRRSLRILPLYYLALFLFLWCLPWLAWATNKSSMVEAFIPAQEQQTFLWSYMTNVQMALVDSWCFGPLDHFWSLAVEEHFYFLWPMVIVFCRARLLAWATIGLAAVCIVSRTAWLAGGGSATAAEVLSVWRCDGLLIGALAAIWIRSPGPAWTHVTALTRWVWLPLLLVAVAIDVTDRRLWLLGICAWNALFFCLLVTIVNGAGPGRLSRFFSLAWLRGLGKLSYGMYVFQSPLIPIAAAFGLKAGVSLSSDMLYVVSMFSLTLGVAWCSWHGFEKQWLRLKNYFPHADEKQLERVEQGGLKTIWAQVRSARS